MSGTTGNSKPKRATPSPDLIINKTWAAALDKALRSWNNLRPEQKTTDNFYGFVDKVLSHHILPHDAIITREIFDQAVSHEAPEGKRKRLVTDDEDYDDNIYHDGWEYVLGAKKRCKWLDTRESVVELATWRRYDKEGLIHWVATWQKLRELVEAHPVLKDTVPWDTLPDVIKKAEEAELKKAQEAVLKKAREAALKKAQEAALQEAREADGTSKHQAGRVRKTAVKHDSTTTSGSVQHGNITVCRSSKELEIISQDSLAHGIFLSLLQLSVHPGMEPKRAKLTQKYLLRRLENPKQYRPKTPPPRLFRRPNSVPPIHSLGTGAYKAHGVESHFFVIPALEEARQEEENRLWTKIVAASSLKDYTTVGLGSTPKHYELDPRVGVLDVDRFWGTTLEISLQNPYSTSEVALSKQQFMERATELWSVLWGLCEHSWPTHKCFPSWPVFNTQTATASFIRDLHEDFLVPTCKNLYTLHKFGITLEEFGMAFSPLLWRIDILLQIRAMLGRTPEATLFDGFTMGNLTILLDYIIDMLLKLELVYPSMDNWQEEHDWTLPSDPLWLGSGRGPYVRTTASTLSASVAADDNEIYKTGTKVCARWLFSAYTHLRVEGKLTRKLTGSGTCVGKDAGTCPLLHPNLRTPRLCTFWLHNKCNKWNCEWVHADPDPEFQRWKPVQVCRNLVFGNVCGKGMNCHYDHDEEVCAKAKEAYRKSNGVCRDYPYCLRGAACHFQHKGPEVDVQPPPKSRKICELFFRFGTCDVKFCHLLHTREETAASPAAPLAAPAVSTPMAQKRPAPDPEDECRKRQKQETQVIAPPAASIGFPMQTPGINANVQLPPSGGVASFGYGRQVSSTVYPNSPLNASGPYRSPVPLVQQQQFRNNPASRTCHYCGGVGHVQRQCWQKQRDNAPGAYGHPKTAGQFMQQPGHMMQYPGAYSSPYTQYSPQFSPQMPPSTPLTAPSPYLQHSPATNSAYASGGYGLRHNDGRPNAPHLENSQMRGTPTPAPKPVHGPSHPQAFAPALSSRPLQPLHQVQERSPSGTLVDRQGYESTEQNKKPNRDTNGNLESQDLKRHNSAGFDQENKRSESRTESRGNRSQLQTDQLPPQRKRRRSEDLDSESTTQKRSKIDVVQNGRGPEDKPRAGNSNTLNRATSGTSTQNEPASKTQARNPPRVSQDEQEKRRRRAQRFGKPPAP
ncbi:hypothetical protein P171DRAFT_505064 [Karstenula rhodostoma CBS 690.94]|uniref:CCHC-type domain-containing protein n=1 Tax=Karstenula rhodostoma CBS 690.94 TaxID=1392251 RepID=A0A9P4P7Z0_9PLEO|nr:hypothetical protein P171DRAFT_505064 [Karstenula rhodostoma CBS 690.94]